MAYESLPDSILTVGKATKRDIFTRIKGNEDDLNERIAALEGSTARIIVFNQLVKKPTEHKVGDVKFSFLSEAEFQKQFDDTWILCDGRDVIGSHYQTLTGNSAVPDFRGRYPRVKDHGAGVNPDGDLALGTLQADNFKSHTHTDAGHNHAITESNHSHGLSNDGHTHPITDETHNHTPHDNSHNHIMHEPNGGQGHAHAITDPSHAHNIIGTVSSGAPNDVVHKDRGPVGYDTSTDSAQTNITINRAVTGITLDSSPSNFTVDAAYSGLTETESANTGGTIDGSKTNLTINTDHADIQGTGSAETRPKTVTVNAFVKINESAFTTSLLWKAPFSFTLLGAVLNNLIAGNAGTLEIDIKKGPDLTALASIFSTRPSINYTAGNYANSTNAVIETPDVVAGEYLRLDIVTMQHAQNKFHVYATGEI